MHSDQINELTAALVKAQSQIKGAAKSATNPHLKNRYASLADVWDACRDALTANGLAVVQTYDGQDDAGIVLVTTLLHTSGQWVRSALRVPLEKPTAQAVGSASTYARRYGLAAMVGVVPDEDDDGHAASQAAPVAARKVFVPADAAVLGSGPSRPQDVRVPFGKQKGTRLGDLKAADLASLSAWCREKGKALEVADAADAVLKDRAQTPPQGFDEVPAAIAAGVTADANDLPFA